ncbi:hypothetical protein HYS97_03260 [Candidatus Daviesbacteria bacterium]|nr:hypothetical protein [Candidatus Daviesbacteria bacterium]
MDLEPPGEGQSFEEALQAYDSKFDQGYEAALARSKVHSAMVIRLDEIPEDARKERVTQLEGKLKEYTNRLAMRSSGSTRYKRDALRTILSRGELDVRAFDKAYREIDGEADPDRLSNALGVIYMYLRTGGRGVSGGTGLPKVRR